MPIANQVKSLAEDIEASYGTRMAAVSDIVKETRQTLGNFNREHQKMADDLKSSLSADNRDRVNEVEKIRAENVRDLKEMAHKLAELLSSSEKGRLEVFATLIEDIKVAVEAIEKDTAKTLADFRSSHREMSEAQRAELVRTTKERIGEVSKKLAEFGREHQEMARQLRGELSSFQKKLESIVREMRAPVIADLKEAKRNWQNLARVMAAKRAGKPIPSPRAEMGVPAAVKEEAKKAFEGGELKERLLKVIQANPGGIKLSQIGKVLGIALIRAAKPIRELLAEVKVTKRDSKYLPT